MNNTRLNAACAPALLAAALLCWPVSAHAQAIENGVDSSIAPGDDFFAFANGGWLHATEIPADKERWGARNEIDELTHRQIAGLIDGAGTAPAGSAARKVADYRTAWLNEAAIEARGLSPLRPLLDSIDRIQDKAALTRLLGSGMRADVDPLNYGVYRSSTLLGLSIEPSIHGEKTYVAFLVQGGLGLADRDNYLSAEPARQALRAKYLAYIGRLLSLAGFDHPQQRAEAVLALETAIAQTQATPQASANDHNADTTWTHPEFFHNAPGMNWHNFFVAAGVAGEERIVPWQPSAIRGVGALVASQPIETWKDYLRFHLLDDDADVLPRAFADQALAMHAAVNGQAQPSPRAQRAIEATQSAMRDAIGKMYAERNLSAAQKARVQAIVANVSAAFVRRVEAVTWMSPATKIQALAKLRTLYVGIGYPDHWQDYSDLAVDPTDALGNLRRARDRDYRHAVARLGQPVDLTEWWMAPQTVGAILVFQQNAYDFPAALMQAPKFDSAASDAAAYGSIGALIGHDISHFVDVLGADYDTTGAERHWWTAEDMTRFQASAAPLVDQVSGYRPFADLGVDGRLTETENVADLAGLSAAFEAYRRTLGNRATDREYVRQQDRQFFIAFARSWRSRIRENALRTQLISNDHAPETFRVATVRNLDAWYDAFDVRTGQRLYLESGARVRVW
jgi:predicted metalloendopeptidase